MSKEKSLMEILEELALYVLKEFGNPNELKVILPDSVVQRYSKTLQPIEKFTLVGSVSKDSVSKDSLIRTLYTHSGSVEIFSSKTHSVIENK